jgi:hypothetical protein
LIRLEAIGLLARGLSSMSVPVRNVELMENLQNFDGLTALEESAIRLHEIYKSLMSGGFTQDEALTLIAKMTTLNA